MNSKMIKRWKKVIDQIINSSSDSYLRVNIVPFDDETIKSSEEIIQSALKFAFASMDAMIAATAKDLFNKLDEKDKYLVTSDKSLQIALKLHNIPYWDAFSNNDMVLNNSMPNIAMSAPM